MIRTCMAMTMVLALTTAACSVDPSCMFGNCRRSQAGEQEDGVAGDDAEATAAAAPACTVRGRSHVGLGGVDVAAAPVDGPAGDHARMKPFSALVTEYQRLLGAENVPASLGAAANTFGVASDRWYLEPRASAVYIDAAFGVGFEGCTSLLRRDARFSAIPTKETAREECTRWTRRFWSREATPKQLDACVAVAVETTTEPAAERRWAYACASVLTATEFLAF